MPRASWELTLPACTECRSQAEQVPALHPRVQSLLSCLGLELSLQRPGFRAAEAAGALRG